MRSNELPIKIPTSIFNLYLRSPQTTQHDAEGLYKIFGHKFNSRFEPERPGRTEPSIALYSSRIPNWLEMAKKGQNCFCLIVLEPQDQSGEDEIIGFGGFNAFSVKPSPEGNGDIKIANVGVMIHEPFTGKGYGIAALRATIQASFEIYQADVVELETLAVNDPFRALMKKFKLDQFSELRFDNGLEDILYTFTMAQWKSLM